MKDMNNTPWLSFSSVKDTQDTLADNVERLCILGVLKQQQVSNKALLSFIVPNKIEPYDFLAIFGKYQEVSYETLTNSQK